MPSRYIDQKKTWELVVGSSGALSRCCATRTERSSDSRSAVAMLVGGLEKSEIEKAYTNQLMMIIHTPSGRRLRLKVLGLAKLGNELTGVLVEDFTQNRERLRSRDGILFHKSVNPAFHTKSGEYQKGNNLLLRGRRHAIE